MSEFSSCFGDLMIYPSDQVDELCPEIAIFKPILVCSYMKGVINKNGRTLAIADVGHEVYVQLLPMEIWNRYDLPDALLDTARRGRNF